MSGHSKWSTIKHKKAATDARRSKVFTQMARAIAVAAQGGGDPESNFILRMAIDQARAVNVPKDNIERAIKRGTGELKDGARIETVVYEAMGPGGVAMLIMCATDNMNRTVSEVKTALKKNDGKFVSGGGVMFQFAHIGQIVVGVGAGGSDEVELVAIEAGAEDIDIAQNENGDEVAIISTQITDLQSVRDALESAGHKVQIAQIIYKPKQEIEITSDDVQKYQQLHDALEDVDDVSEIYTNVIEL